MRPVKQASLSGWLIAAVFILGIPRAEAAPILVTLGVPGCMDATNIPTLHGVALGCPNPLNPQSCSPIPTSLCQ